MGDIHQNATTAYTSLGLFAPNCIYNNSLYSDFNTNPNDYEAFYSQERHMFAGADRNPETEDNSGFKGYSNWVPAASTITIIPFETNFSTGHGLKKFTNGIETSNSAWHNMNDQDILPSWQFAFSDNNLSGSWDFNTAYNSGSSLSVDGTLAAGIPINLKLYKTKLLLNADSKIDITYNYQLAEDSEIKLLLTFPGSTLSTFEKDVSPNGNTGWITKTIDLNEFAGQELSIIGLKFSTSQTISNYTVKLGSLKVYEDPSLSITNNVKLENAIIITYSNNNTNYINITSDLKTNTLDFSLYNIQGQNISNHSFNPTKGTYRYNTSKISSGLYLLKFKTKNGEQITKKIIIK